MSAQVEVLACPVPASIQDLGRPGYRHLGVPLSGALDGEWLQLLNALLGNTPNAAAIEMRLAGPRLRAVSDCVFALAGEMEARITGSDGQSRAVTVWQSQVLRTGEELRIAAIASGVAYLGFAGGISCTPQLGSRATYVRAGLGGLNGGLLQSGDQLKLGAGEAAPPALPLCRLAAPPPRHTTILRVLPGPQRHHFSDAAWETLLSSEFEVSREADRMGLRLLGPPLSHITPQAADIVSDAVTPGIIQVPGDGRAIVLLADCQTVGGYPKLACIISADLPLLGHALPGCRLRFSAVTLDEALSARRGAAATLDACRARITPLAADADTLIDLDALYAANLITGVVHET